MNGNEAKDTGRTTVSGWGLWVSTSGHLHIIGMVRNHPRLPDGPVDTTRILSIEKQEGRTIAVTRNTRYELLDPHPDFDRLYPRFKERIWPGPVPGYMDLLLSAQ